MSTKYNNGNTREPEKIIVVDGPNVVIRDYKEGMDDALSLPNSGYLRTVEPDGDIIFTRKMVNFTISDGEETVTLRVTEPDLDKVKRIMKGKKLVVAGKTLKNGATTAGNSDDDDDDDTSSDATTPANASIATIEMPDGTYHKGLVSKRKRKSGTEYSVLAAQKKGTNGLPAYVFTSEQALKDFLKSNNDFEETHWQAIESSSWKNSNGFKLGSAQAAFK